MSDICKKFGKNVHKYRLKKGLSQEKMAEIAGLHRIYISAVERGKRSISLKNIERIANALGVKINKLFEFEED